MTLRNTNKTTHTLKQLNNSAIFFGRFVFISYPISMDFMYVAYMKIEIVYRQILKFFIV